MASMRIRTVFCRPLVTPFVTFSLKQIMVYRNSILSYNSRFSSSSTLQCCSFHRSKCHLCEVDALNLMQMAVWGNNCLAHLVHIMRFLCCCELRILPAHLFPTANLSVLVSLKMHFSLGAPTQPITSHLKNKRKRKIVFKYLVLPFSLLSN